MQHNGVPYNSSTPKKVWRKVRKTIIIDSRDRQQTTTSSPGSYTVVLPAVYQNVYSITLRSYEVPLTYNMFAACQSNTTFNMTWTPTGGSAQTSNVTIPDGNYTSASLPLAITYAMQSNAGFTTAGSSAPSNLNAYWNSTTGKLGIYSTLSTDAIALTFNPSQSPNCGQGQNFPATTGWGLGYYMGYYPTSYTSSLSNVTVTTNNVTSNYTGVNGSFIMNPSPDTYVVMELAGLNKIDETGLDGRVAGRIDGCFAKIPVTVNQGEYMYFIDTSGPSPLNQRIYNPPIARLDRLTVRWRRHDGRTLDFNGGEHSFTLEIETLDNNFDEYSSLEFSR
jgi:hypothetical protein